jgi:SHS2 domain-containing protein
MKSYEYLEHTADVRLKVNANCQHQLFNAAIEGMANLIKHNSCPTKNFDLKEKFEIAAPDSTALLVDFLSEVLTYSQVKKAVYCKATFKKLTDNFLKATIYGTKIESFDEDIKAVTYHEAEIVKDYRAIWKRLLFLIFKIIETNHDTKRNSKKNIPRIVGNTKRLPSRHESPCTLFCIRKNA